MKKVTLGSIQMSMSWNKQDTLDKAEKLVRKAASQGAQIILLPELFETPYFCQEKNYDFYNLATTLEENEAIKRF